MQGQRLAGVAVVCLLALARPIPAASAAPEDGAQAPAGGPTLFRLFLKDGTSLVSYGEFARVADRVVFSMPTSASAANPQLHLVDIPGDRVDWDKTTNYVRSARASRYIATRAESDYAKISAEIELTLNQAATISDPARRLQTVEQARRRLAEWPPSHYDYKQDEVRQMLTMIDEAILDLRAAAGVQNFDLQLRTTTQPPPAPLVPLLPPPTAKETIEQTLAAANLSVSSVERMSLLSIAMTSLQRDRDSLPDSWASAVSMATAAAISRETEIDRTYQSLTQRMVTLANARARVADVRGIASLINEVRAKDQALGKARPETVANILAAIDAQLQAAQKLKLARDRWALRVDEIRAYRTSVEPWLQRLLQVRPALEDIKGLAGSTPDELAGILRATGVVQRNASVLVPPDEMREMHGMLLSAAQLADSAARIRREAALSGDLSRARDASSAAAGALMLAGRAQAELQTAMKIPELPQ